uniref:Uncharacterized protein n=1 Tax=Rhizophora mucronata TaxID=61149 RepID=A0A2P2PPF5_RHIMU
MAKVSASSITRSQDFRHLRESLRLLRTNWERKRSVLEMRLSSEYSSVISRNSPAQRRGATVEGLRSTLTP